MSDEIQLNDNQRLAVETTSGPVVILAGAGTGKTATVTHRIANQVHSGAFDARSIFAVTFTRKAAEELRHRLSRLGIDVGTKGVQARTFHSHAFWHLKTMWSTYTGEPMPQLDADAVHGILEPFRRQHDDLKYVRRIELSQLIEKCRALRIPPCASARDPRITRELGEISASAFQEAFEHYRSEMQQRRLWDFTDVIENNVRLMTEFPEARQRIQDRFHAFTVDEYQDVSEIQQAALDQWLGDRQDLCVVGDDYQSIYAFQGGTPDYLTGFDSRFPDAEVIPLATNYRSTPQVLEVANKLSPKLANGRKPRLLDSHRSDGPPAATIVSESSADEAREIASRIRTSIAAGRATSDIAVLYRNRSQSAPLEAALNSKGIPFVVSGGGLLKRSAYRDLRAACTRISSAPPSSITSEIAQLEADPRRFSQDVKQERDADFQALRELVERTNAETAAEFWNDLERQFGEEESADRVTLSTFHGSKGLEWPVVFVTNADSATLPHKYKDIVADQQEERRLFYVAITRARDELVVSWAGRPSMYVRECGLAPAPAPPAATTAQGNRRTPVMPSPAAAAIATLEPGARIHHKSFGEGVVSSVKGKTAWVKFGGSVAAKSITLPSRQITVI